MVGTWYTEAGNEVSSEPPVNFVSHNLDVCIQAAMERLGAELLIKNEHYSWALMKIDGKKRLLLSHI